MAEHDIMALNSLIATTIDSANGFEESARRAQSTSLGDQLADLARDRWAVVSTLQGEVASLGGQPRQSGTAKAAAHRRWLDLRHAVATSDRAILQEIENGETYLRNKYEMALERGELSEPARRALTEAFDSVCRGHDRARTLGLGFATGLPERTQVNWRAVGTGLGFIAAIGGAVYAFNRSRSMGYRSNAPAGRTRRMTAPAPMRSATSSTAADASLGESRLQTTTSQALGGATLADSDRGGAARSAARSSRRGGSDATRLAASGDDAPNRDMGSTGGGGSLGSEGSGSPRTFGAAEGDDLK